MDRRRFLCTLGMGAAAVLGYSAGVLKPARADETPCDMSITGDFSGTIPAGEAWRLDGNVNLTGNVVVEGTLVGSDFHVQGNGHEVMVHNGGRLDLAGAAKTGWCRWGDAVTGWQTGDRLAVAPTAPGVQAPTVITWQGSWGATTRPIGSPDVVLSDGSTAKPEVANLTRTATLENLTRVMMHMGAGVQSIRHVAVVDTGVAGTLSLYPLHFHLLGENARGSLVEGVVVENGQNHAVVPHGSHGVTVRDTVAFNTLNVPFWWDEPTGFQDTSNNSNDTLYDRCLALGVDFDKNLHTGTWHTLSGFELGAGMGNVCRDSVAVGVLGGNNTSGFHWPSQANQNQGGNVWGFTGNVAHNCKHHGIRVWQNDDNLHVVEDFVAYGCERGVNHGAYRNLYTYRDLVLEEGLVLHALSKDSGEILFENVSTPLVEVVKHTQDGDPVRFLTCDIGSVFYDERTNNPSHIVYEDCGLVPADFNMTGAHTGTTVDIVENGAVVYSFSGGSW